MAQLEENIGDDEVVGGPSLGNTRGKRQRVDAPASQSSGHASSSEEEESASEGDEADLDLRRIRARWKPLTRLTETHWGVGGGGSCIEKRIM